MGLGHRRRWSYVSPRISIRTGHLQKRLPTNSATARSAVFYLRGGRALFRGTIVDHLGQAGLLKQDGRTSSAGSSSKSLSGSDLQERAGPQRAHPQAGRREASSTALTTFLGKEVDPEHHGRCAFANGMFEPTWRREYIDHVQITAAETIGVEQRGAFYEPTGCLRDMVPNHLFPAFLHDRHGAAEFVQRPRTCARKKPSSSRRTHPVEITEASCAASTRPGPGVRRGRSPGYRQEAKVDPQQRGRKRTSRSSCAFR